MAVMTMARAWRAKMVGALALAALVLPSKAPAAHVLFTLDTGADVLAFTLPQAPTPSPGVVTTDYFGFWNLDATLNDTPVVIELIQFWAGGFARGGFDARINSALSFHANGPQLYSGPTNSPTFLTGSFTTRGGALSIESVGAAVPEPGAWALMILGFGGVGAVVRVRRSRTLSIEAQAAAHPC
ncbi:hypothetical protein DJ019_13285 [Phenylobacterium kunshanense]|uniref:Ice-binding protein C-terminal domain-containing protein n=1 Tax=Phenylobacterium kunshanense TaxID=1445034 RepID=A0A328BCZ5_9CAUL|nr:PEPxxWA-CTERM sorting domain-containing protein [Phenylobacterium kunshanense]RAK64973.1 hypothetical protein DJ019_13285 [Phenylobacterium kunshanense]